MVWASLGNGIYSCDQADTKVTTNITTGSYLVVRDEHLYRFNGTSWIVQVKNISATITNDVVNVLGNGPLQFSRTAQASAGESILTAKISDDTTGSVWSIENGTGADGAFVPQMSFKNMANNNFSGIFLITTSLDTGTNPVFVIDSRVNSSPLATRALLGLNTFGNQKYMFYPTFFDMKGNTLKNAVIDSTVTGIVDANVSLLSHSKIGTNLKLAETGLTAVRTFTFPDTSGLLVLDADTRLTNSRTPTAHASTHSSGGSDPITISNLAGTIGTSQLPSGIPHSKIGTNLILSETGLTAVRTFTVPDISGQLMASTNPLPNDGTLYYSGNGTWTAPSGTGVLADGSITDAKLAGISDKSKLPSDTAYANNVLTFTQKTINVLSNPLLHIGQYKYEIFKDGSTWYCRNTLTGAIDSSNTDPTVVLQYAVTNIAGYAIKVKADTLLLTAKINCVDKYLCIDGEGSSTSGSAGVAGATIIKANFTGATGDALFNCLNTGYTKQYFKNIVIDCNGTVDYGIDAFGIRESENFIDNVAIINYKKSALRLNQCWMSSIRNPNFIPGTSQVVGSKGIEMIRPSGAPCNTIRVSKGRIANNDINISMDATNGNMIEGVALEGAYVSAVKTFNGANANVIRDNSFEYAQLSSIVVIDEAGNANVYESNRFDAAHTAYNIITVRAAARNLVFSKNLIQANNASTTATIIIEAGATGIDFFNNKQLVNTPLTVSITDGQPSQTQWIGNSFVQDRLRTGIQLGSNQLWLKEVDANTLGLYASDGTTRKNFLSNAYLTSVIRTTGSTDMINFPDASTINYNSKTFTNFSINTSTAGNTITSTSTAAGDILKSDGTKYDKLARGTANQVLAVNPGGTDIAWASLNSERTGTATASGNGSSVTFNVLHGLGSTPYVAFIQCSSHTNAFTYTYDGTNIIVVFTTAPPSGTNNVVFQWRVIA